MSATDYWCQLKALAVDGPSFAMMNALQVRARGGPATDPQGAQYFDRLAAEGTTAWLSPPPGLSLDLVAGRCELPSPLPSGVPANDRLRLDIRLGPDGWRSPAIIFLHALMSVSDRGYQRWSQRLNARGWTAIFTHLPYHYDRCPPGSLSGEMAFTANLGRSAEGLRQAVVELRLVAEALRQRGCPRWGVWANSYGGLVGALLAVCEADLYCAWLLEPIVDLDHALWESPASLVIRRQLRRAGLTRERTAAYLPLLCPRYHRPAASTERMLFLAGRQDRIAPPAVVRSLAESWPGSTYAEGDQGHVGYTLMPACWDLAESRGWFD